MITSVTTVVTAALSTAATASLVGIAIVALVALLIQKEVISGLTGPRAKQLGQALNIALVPLVIVFIFSVVLKMMDVLL